MDAAAAGSHSAHAFIAPQGTPTSIQTPKRTYRRRAQAEAVPVSPDHDGAVCSFPGALQLFVPDAEPGGEAQRALDVSLLLGAVHLQQLCPMG